jgi:hypothetical protein
MKTPAGFTVPLEGGVLELGGWGSIDGLVEDQRERTLQAQLEHASMYRQVFSSPNGRAVLEDLLQMYLRQRIVRPGDDQFAVGIRQGQADVVQRILAMIEFANTGGGRPTGQPSTPTG